MTNTTCPELAPAEDDGEAAVADPWVLVTDDPDDGPLIDGAWQEMEKNDMTNANSTAAT